MAARQGAMGFVLGGKWINFGFPTIMSAGGKSPPAGINRGNCGGKCQSLPPEPVGFWPRAGKTDGARKALDQGGVVDGGRTCHRSVMDGRFLMGRRATGSHGVASSGWIGHRR